LSKRLSRSDYKYHFKPPNEDKKTAYCQFWDASGSMMMQLIFTRIFVPLLRSCVKDSALRKVLSKRLERNFY
jgi:hypothetical protein